MPRAVHWLNLLAVKCEAAYWLGIPKSGGACSSCPLVSIIEDGDDMKFHSLALVENDLSYK